MLFTVELSHYDLCFRLQKDKSWRQCITGENLLKSDFTSRTTSEIIEHSSTKGMIKINGTEYHVDPDQIEYFSKEKYLSHSSSIFRREYPKEPNHSQLRDAITRGDDEVNNCLILNVNGNFELRQAPPFNDSINDPSIVVRHKSTDAGNGYIGPDAVKDEKMVLDLFVSSLEYWKNHLKYHITQKYSDDHASMTLEQIEKELEGLRNNWKPDY